MTEALLQYAWKTLRFRADALLTNDGQQVVVLQPGRQNTDQGPDFLNARLLIGGTEWAGAVELHLSTADWYRHKHQNNPAYNNVVLHVVYQTDGKPVALENGLTIPEVALEKLLDPDLVAVYNRLVGSENELPCAGSVETVSQLHRAQWVARCGYQRMADRATELGAGFRYVAEDWEQLLWTEMIGAFGGSVNKQAFRQLGKVIPVKLLKKYADRPDWPEALLFGGAGFLLQPIVDEYGARLRSEWLHLSHKHALDELDASQFSFLRMRPVNFPTVRLAQIAAYITAFPHPAILLDNPKIFFEQAASVSVSPYWLEHYRFDKPSKPVNKGIGRQLAESVMLNALIPVCFNYFRLSGKDEKAEKTLALLEELKAEDNHITEIYQKQGFKIRNALESQGILHLQRHYCAERRCAECGLGHQIFKQIPPFQFD